MKKRKEGFTVSEESKPKLSSFEQTLMVDQDNLDEEVIRQPELYYHVSEQLVYAIDARDTLKKEIEELEAEVDNKVRALAERNEDKVTEPFVKKQIAANEDVQELQRKFLKAKKTAALWEAMKESYGQRSYAVNKLADLIIARTMGSGGSVRDVAVDQVRRRQDEKRTERRERR